MSRLCWFLCYFILHRPLLLALPNPLDAAAQTINMKWLHVQFHEWICSSSSSEWVSVLGGRRKRGISNFHFRCDAADEICDVVITTGQESNTGLDTVPATTTTPSKVGAWRTMFYADDSHVVAVLRVRCIFNVKAFQFLPRTNLVSENSQKAHA